MQLTNKRKPILFVDMDGTLAEWRPIQIPLQVPSSKIQEYIHQNLYQKNYFNSLYPYKNMVKAIKQIIEDDKMDVYILSCFLPDHQDYPESSPLQDKKIWLKRQFGDLLNDDHCIFVPDGEPKIDHIPFPLQSGDILLDDYTHNLHAWIQGAPKGIELKGIKAINPVNDTNGTFKGPRISILQSADQIQNFIYKVGDMKTMDIENKFDQAFFIAIYGLDKKYQTLITNCALNCVYSALSNQIPSNYMILQDAADHLSQALQDFIQSIHSHIHLITNSQYLEDTKRNELLDECSSLLDTANSIKQLYEYIERDDHETTR